MSESLCEVYTFIKVLGARKRKSSRKKPVISSLLFCFFMVKEIASRHFLYVNFEEKSVLSSLE